MIINRTVDLSIIIPFYKGQDFYPLLLKSIAKGISSIKSQNLYFEIITVIDSMETDRDAIHEIVQTAFEKLKESNVILITIKNQVNLGVAKSRNIAISISKGNFLHLIDQDDYVDENFYLVVTPLTKEYNFIMVNGRVNYANTRFNTHKLLYFSPNLSLKGLIKDDFIRSPGQVIFSKKFVSEFRFPEPKVFKGADDRFFWLRIFFRYEAELRVVFVKKPLYIANIHKNNFSNDSKNLRQSSLENWDILTAQENTANYNKLIKADIISLRFAAGEKMSLPDKLFGAFYRFLYFLDFNKVVRFYHKRIRF